jgi:hypothetical protein
MWGEIERSPVLAAPSFNDCIGTTSSTIIIDGQDDEKTQAANDLCLSYLPLAYKIAGRYRDRPAFSGRNWPSPGVTQVQC